MRIHVGRVSEQSTSLDNYFSSFNVLQNNLNFKFTNILEVNFAFNLSLIATADHRPPIKKHHFLIPAGLFFHTFITRSMSVYPTGQVFQNCSHFTLSQKSEPN